MPIVAGAGDVDRRHLAVLLVLVVETLAHRRVARACREAAHEHAARLAGHGRRRRRGAAARLARHRRVTGGTVRRRPARRRPTTAAGTAAAAQPGVLSCRSTLYCRLATLAAAAAVTTTPHTHAHALAATNKHTFTLTTKPFDSELHFFFLVIISHPEQWSLQ